jgi:DNA-binding FrmR family transcriptional regulator
MAHTIKQRDKLLTRVRKIRGQTEGLEKLLAKDGECSRILQQLAAIRGAINGLIFVNTWERTILRPQSATRMSNR